MQFLQHVIKGPLRISLGTAWMASYAGQQLCDSTHAVLGNTNCVLGNINCVLGNTNCVLGNTRSALPHAATLVPSAGKLITLHFR